MAKTAARVLLAMTARETTHKDPTVTAKDVAKELGLGQATACQVMAWLYDKGCVDRYKLDRQSYLYRLHDDYALRFVIAST